MKNTGPQKNSPSDWEGKRTWWLIICLVFFGLAPIVGHVGDGNFHCVVVFDLECEDELRKVKEFIERLARYVNIWSS